MHDMGASREGCVAQPVSTYTADDVINACYYRDTRYLKADTITITDAAELGCMEPKERGDAGKVGMSRLEVYNVVLHLDGLICAMDSLMTAVLRGAISGPSPLVSRSSDTASSLCTVPHVAGRCCPDRACRCAGLALSSWALHVLIGCGPLVRCASALVSCAATPLSFPGYTVRLCSFCGRPGPHCYGEGLYRKGDTLCIVCFYSLEYRRCISCVRAHSGCPASHPLEWRDLSRDSLLQVADAMNDPERHPSFSLTNRIYVDHLVQYCDVTPGNVRKPTIDPIKFWEGPAALYLASDLGQEGADTFVAKSTVELNLNATYSQVCSTAHVHPSPDVLVWLCKNMMPTARNCTALYAPEVRVHSGFQCQEERSSNSEWGRLRVLASSLYAIGSIARLRDANLVERVYDDCIKNTRGAIQGEYDLGYPIGEFRGWLGLTGDTVTATGTPGSIRVSMSEEVMRAATRKCSKRKREDFQSVLASCGEALKRDAHTPIPALHPHVRRKCRRTKRPWESGSAPHMAPAYVPVKAARRQAYDTYTRGLEGLSGWGAFFLKPEDVDLLCETGCSIVGMNPAGFARACSRSGIVFDSLSKHVIQSHMLVSLPTLSAGDTYVCSDWPTLSLTLLWCMLRISPSFALEEDNILGALASEGIGTDGVRVCKPAHERGDCNPLTLGALVSYLRGASCNREVYVV